jgi:hypothetical protein
VIIEAHRIVCAIHLISYCDFGNIFTAEAQSFAKAELLILGVFENKIFKNHFASLRFAVQNYRDP